MIVVEDLFLNCSDGHALLLLHFFICLDSAVIIVQLVHDMLCTLLLCPLHLFLHFSKARRVRSQATGYRMHQSNAQLSGESEAVPLPSPFEFAFFLIVVSFSVGSIRFPSFAFLADAISCAADHSHFLGIDG